MERNCSAELITRTNFLLGLLPFTERNGILFQKEYLPDPTIKSDNGMSFSPVPNPFAISIWFHDKPRSNDQEAIQWIAMPDKSPSFSHVKVNELS